ncbi:MAG: MerR family transcriptional regulator [Clostridia bacterium]|nr:MerR family transcriptional regulator [Clostridia bacterium]
MLTIRGFAKLCGCSTQTLRYYDRIGLLKPAKVDAWTGYRYYEEEQSLLFVKIKNLQQADFSIEEIKTLLPGDDGLLMAAFDRKIEEQHLKLKRIEEIKRSYLQEKMDMQNMLSVFMDFVEGQMNKPILWQEFGLDDQRKAETQAKVQETLVDWLTACREASHEIAQQMNSQDANTIKMILETLTSGNPAGDPMLYAITNEEHHSEGKLPPNAQKVFERSGWEHVSEWINDIPALGSGKQNYFLFRVRGDSPAADPGFPTLMLAVMDVLYDAMKGGMNCTIDRSSDGLNHFELLQG